MLMKIFQVPIMTCIYVRDFVLGLKKDERGLSGVVVAILLILVAVLAVVLIWGFLSGWLSSVWDNIVGQAGSIS